MEQTHSGKYFVKVTQYGDFATVALLIFSSVTLQSHNGRSTHRLNEMALTQDPDTNVFDHHPKKSVPCMTPLPCAGGDAPGWGRYAVEVRDLQSKEWRWLGTFDMVEEAACTYDCVTRAICSAKDGTNFVYPSPPVRRPCRQTIVFLLRCQCQRRLRSQLLQPLPPPRLLRYLPLQDQCYQEVTRLAIIALRKSRCLSGRLDLFFYFTFK